MEPRASPELPPIQRVIGVPLPIDQAFDLFVRRLPEWWPLKTRSVWGAEAVSCHVEARVGGRLFERNARGEESCWGTFVSFAEPTRVVFTWHPGLPPTTSTEVDVRFAPIAAGTSVSLEHRGWERLGERASFVRGLVEGGWSPILARFEALARGERALPDVTGPGCIPSEPAGQS
jgi:uncharacterized protein YndB with AHSA1/START domain